jgi:MFS family permease
MSFTSGRADVRRIVVAKSLSWLGDTVATVALMLRLQGHGAGAAAVAALLIANAAPLMLLSGVVGQLVDRYDNRRLLVVSSLAQAAVCAAVAFVHPTAAVLALVAALGAGQAVNGAAWQALLAAVVEGDDLTRAIGHTQAGRTLAGVVAPAVAGVLSGLWGARLPLLLDAAAYVAVTAMALAVATRRVPAPPAPGQPRHTGLAIARADAVLAPLLVLVALFVLLGSMVNVVDVFLVRETLHASAALYGVVGAALSAGMFVGALLAGRLRGPLALARGFVASAVALALSIAAAGLAPTVWWLIACTVALGTTNGVLNVTLGALAMGRARADQRGRVGALISGVASGTQIGAFAAGGALATVFSPRQIFVVAGLSGVVAPVLLGRGLLRAVRAGSEPVPSAAESDGQALFSRRSRLGVSRGTRVG